MDAAQHTDHDSVDDLVEALKAGLLGVVVAQEAVRQVERIFWARPVHSLARTHDPLPERLAVTLS